MHPGYSSRSVSPPLPRGRTHTDAVPDRNKKKDNRNRSRGRYRNRKNNKYSGLGVSSHTKAITAIEAVQPPEQIIDQTIQKGQVGDEQVRFHPVRLLSTNNVYRSVMAAAFMLLLFVSASALYQMLQIVHRQYCSRNLINAILFSNSDACMYLSSTISALETACSRELKIGLLSVGWAGFRVFRHLAQHVRDDHHGSCAGNTRARTPTPRHIHRNNAQKQQLMSSVE